MKTNIFYKFNNKKNYIYFLLFIFLFFAPPFFNLTKAANQSTDVTASSKMIEFAQDIGITTNADVPLQNKIMQYINIVLSFLGLILLVLIIIAGIQWMTSGGNEEIIKKSKSRIKNAIIGLAIVLLSYTLATFIIRAIYLGTTTYPNDVWIIN